MADQLPRIRRSVIVGLGGTGASVVLYTKAALMRLYGKIPYSLRFLVFDTDSRLPMPINVNVRGREYKQVELEQQEYYYLRVDDPVNVINQSESIKKWWPPEIPTRAILNGAGGWRARGRLGFYSHAHDAEGIIQRAVANIMADDVSHNMCVEQGLDMIEGSVEIYIISSLAGGTGSGSFIDAGFLFRQALQNVMHRVIGFFILPSVFEGLPATHRVKINGYAALKELDYYLDLNYQTNRPRFTFGTKEIVAEVPPYDVTNLVDAAHEGGNVLPGKGTDKGIDNLCRIVGDGIALNVGNIGQRAESAIDNLYDHIVSQNAKNWGGKEPHYSTIGVSSIIYPMEKHFSKVATSYAFELVDGLLDRVKEANLLGKEEDEERRIEEEIERFISQRGLEKERLPEYILPSERLIFHLSSEGCTARGDIDFEIKNTESQRDKIKKDSEERYHEYIQETKEEVRRLLQEKEKAEGGVYSRKAAEKLLSCLNVYMEDLSNQKKAIDDEKDASFKMTQDSYEEVKKTRRFVLPWKKGEIFQGHLDQEARFLRDDLDSFRCDKALRIYSELVRVIQEYRDSLSLDAIERKLSDVRQRIYHDCFGTSKLVEQYGQYSLIIFPKELFTEAKAPSSLPNREIIHLPFDLGKLDISTPNIMDFLNSEKINMGEIERMEATDLYHRIMAYTHERVKSIEKFGIEKILTPQKDLGYWIREASHRAAPLWRHQAAAEMASMMEEIFILGVADEYNTKLRGFRFPNTKYDPTLTSTSDPYKILMFKYKAPLPAYLLSGMDRYRLQYLDTPIEGTPHIAPRMELNLTDIFPKDIVHRQTLRLYIMAMALGLIKKELISDRPLFVIVDPRFLSSGEEMSGLDYPAWKAFEELKRKGRKGLRETFSAVIKEEMDKEPTRAKDALESYRHKIKDRFDRRTPSMSLGDEILLFEQIITLDTFFREGANLDHILRLQEV